MRRLGWTRSFLLWYFAGLEDFLVIESVNFSLYHSLSSLMLLAKRKTGNPFKSKFERGRFNLSFLVVVGVVAFAFAFVLVVVVIIVVVVVVAVVVGGCCCCCCWCWCYC